MYIGLFRGKCLLSNDDLRMYLYTGEVKVSIPNHIIILLMSGMDTPT